MNEDESRAHEPIAQEPEWVVPLKAKARACRECGAEVAFRYEGPTTIVCLDLGAVRVTKKGKSVAPRHRCKDGARLNG